MYNVCSCVRSICHDRPRVFNIDDKETGYLDRVCARGKRQKCRCYRISYTSVLEWSFMSSSEHSCLRVSIRVFKWEEIAWVRRKDRTWEQKRELSKQTNVRATKLVDIEAARSQRVALLSLYGTRNTKRNIPVTKCNTGSYKYIQEFKYKHDIHWK